jgi:hypothetical protein
MVTREKFVHFGAGHCLDRSGLRRTDERLTDIMLLFRDRLAAIQMSLDQPPNQIGRRGPLLASQRLQLPEDSVWEFDCGLHTIHCLMSDRGLTRVV